MLPYLFFNPPAVQFSVIIKPLFESFKGVVSTSSLEELHRTALSWLDEHCSLPVLRPSEWGRGAVGLWGLADPFMLSSREGPWPHLVLQRTPGLLQTPLMLIFCPSVKVRPFCVIQPNVL